MFVVLGISALAVLISIAAYLAASETALMSVSRIRVRFLAEKKVPQASRLERLIEEPGRLFPSLLLLVLTVQIMSASLATWLAIRITGSEGMGIAAGTAVVTAFIFLFGELIPRAAAGHDSEKVALRVARPIHFVSSISRPFAVAFEKAAKLMLRVFFRRELNVENMLRGEGERIAIVSTAEEHTVIEKEEKKMIHSVFEFGDMVVREVMVPRPDMVTAPIESTVREALELTIEHGFSRIPVHQGTLDNIHGLLYAKDLLKQLKAEKMEQGIEDLVREAYVIPETKGLSDLLKELQRRKVHMAIVVDEHGTVTGLVTIEDLLEEIVGEIFDEYDREVKLIEQLSPGRFSFDARVAIDDLNDILGTELPDDGVDSVGGLVFKVLGEVPDEGATFVLDGAAFTVEEVASNRIEKVVVELLSERPEQEA